MNLTVYVYKDYDKYAEGVEWLRFNNVKAIDSTRVGGWYIETERSVYCFPSSVVIAYEKPNDDA